MSDLAADLRNIATEARPVLRRRKDDAAILAGLGKVCREKGIDWAQLKALLNAELADQDDESGEGDAVTKILDKADAASAYADLLFRKMNNEKFSSPRQSFENFEQLASAPEKPADAIEPAAVITTYPEHRSPTDASGGVHDDLAIPPDGSIPKFLRRAQQEALS